MNLIGTALPALTVFTTPLMSTVWKNPVNAYVTLMGNVPLAMLPAPSVAVQVGVVVPTFR
ncbi:hypothetical protein GCM10008960_36690 [Deinococcus sedimenti]|uniref:Uncharacterized protein n=1 Tax=Deinococcus sedimenti TaxID=1867090 RepID=A0ABQ2SAW4_9DEIO|nr:hypothetical protein GCM10008960_36690 [Deinococcus sedimenti]